MIRRFAPPLDLIFIGFIVVLLLTLTYVYFRLASVDLQLYDTYYVINAFQFALAVSSVFLVLWLTIRQVLLKKPSQPLNYAVGAGLLVLLVFISYRTASLTAMLNLVGGWVVYPPLNAQAPTPAPLAPVHDPYFLTYLLYALQFLLGSLLLLLGMRIGQLSRPQ